VSRNLLRPRLAEAEDVVHCAKHMFDLSASPRLFAVLGFLEFVDPTVEAVPPVREVLPARCMLMSDIVDVMFEANHNCSIRARVNMLVTDSLLLSKDRELPTVHGVHPKFDIICDPYVRQY